MRCRELQTRVNEVSGSLHLKGVGEECRNKKLFMGAFTACASQENDLGAVKPAAELVLACLKVRL